MLEEKEQIQSFNRSHALSFAQSRTDSYGAEKS